MEKITTTIDGKSTREFTKSTYLLDFVALAASLLCIALYIVFGIANNDWTSSMQLVILIVGILLLVLALALLFVLSKTIKKANEFNRTITYQFDDEYLVYEVTRNNETIENGKLPYTDLVKYKETKNYVFVELKNNTWFVIDKVDSLISFLEGKGIHKK